MYIIGVDIGTTSTKAVVFDDLGGTVARAERAYPLLHPLPHSAEQRPEEIVAACIQVLNEVMMSASLSEEAVSAVSFSAAMHSLMIIDCQGRPKSPLLTWADERSTGATERLKERIGLSLYKKTGTPLHPMSPLTKMAWIQEGQAPWTLQPGDRFISIKEYVFYCFFGVCWTDESMASATGLYDFTKREWSKEALQAAQISAHNLPDIKPTKTVLRGLKKDIARETGLNEKTPFILGATDGVLANLGAGAKNDDMVMTIGTSGAIRCTLDHPVTHENGHTFCYHLSEDAWVVGGAMNNGGIVLQWAKHHLFKEAKKGRTPEELNLWFEKEAAKVPPGCEGLICLPYLHGERAPFWETGLQGGFLGMTSRHETSHFCRALYEGVLFQLKMVAEAVWELSPAKGKLYINGGFVRSHFWTQMLADIFNKALVMPSHHDVSSKGAAALARQALGYPPFPEDDRCDAEQISPNATAVAQYERPYAAYKKLADAMRTLQK
ncbi:gluconokinase [Bacillaceae bacterium SIJ1]|uniref:gluconokinase n=1 Tax=Litoribacterium kuwaitense TaxID=1398745 RepID=UPI0013EA078B|nr:gluconokinase [Litoribacterium kuwaitense]NGP44425.1 gluconokinase [Litoribacterium kuwaitense]